MRYLYSRDPRDRAQSLAGWLLGIDISNVRSLYVQSGYFSDGGLELIKPLLEAVKAHLGEARVVVGANDKGTSEEDARALLSAVSELEGGRCGVCAYGGALFHPKVIYVGLEGGHALGYVGSANLTEQGALRNVEAALTLSTHEGDPHEVLEELKASVQGWFEGEDDAFYELSDEAIKRLVKRKILGEGRTWRAGPAEGASVSKGREGPRRAGRVHTLKQSELKRAIKAQRAQLKSAPVEVPPPSETPPPAELTVDAAPLVKAKAPRKKKGEVTSPLILTSAEGLQPGDLISCQAKGVDFKMAWCPAGEFWMGSEEGVGDIDERPRHRVKISKPFLMGQTQITQALWEAVMCANPSEFKGAQRPVEQVSWYDMARFCNALSALENFRPAYSIGSGDKPDISLDFTANGYRMPTEAEWEYAAKAGTELVYAGSAQLEQVGWFEENSDDETHPVAQKKANAWGLHDISGNVWEWCSDQWDSNAYKSRPEVSIDPCVYASSPAWRVLRGGSWYDVADNCRVAFRYWSVVGYRWEGLGGRLLRWNLDS